MKFLKFTLILGLIAVAGCGGSINAKIGGSVSGLAAGTSVVLLNNGTDALTVNSNGDFTFGSSIESGSNYSVTIKTQPTNATCTVANGTGTISNSGSNVTNIVVTCAGSSTYVPLTVSLAGLKSGAQVTLTDPAAGKLTVTGTSVTESGSTISQNFPTSLAPSAIYNTSITTQPANGQICSILNSTGAGTVPTSGSPSPVAVSCV